MANRKKRVLQARSPDGGQAEDHPRTVAGVQHRERDGYPGGTERSAGWNAQGDDGSRDG